MNVDSSLFQSVSIPNRATLLFFRAMGRRSQQVKSRILIINLAPNMRIQSPDIGWHGEKDRILCIDFHPLTNQVVTAGSDDKKWADEEREGTEGCIKVWEITKGDKSLNIKILYGLAEASNNVNVVKYSPNGALMASGADDKSVTIWEKKQNFKNMYSSDKVYRWSPKTPLLGHSGDVLDLAWTNNSKLIVSVGMDGRIFIWNVEKKVYIHYIDSHDKFVQGIALDPLLNHMVSCSNDRSSRLFDALKPGKSTKKLGFYTKRVYKRLNFNKKDEEENEGADDKGGFRMFADENIPTFFRRPDFSPEGELFILPAGQWQANSEATPEYCAFLFRKNFADKPTLIIPTAGEPALVCKFCPILFKKPEDKQGLFQQNYYMVYAIATTGSVLIYDTLSMEPIYGMGNYHYATITSLSWRGPNILAISSSDGFCSFMIFENGELGQPYTPEGELAEVMKIEAYVEKKDQAPQMIQEQKVEYRQVEGGGTKKSIKPSIIQKFE